MKHTLAFVMLLSQMTALVVPASCQESDAAAPFVAELEGGAVWQSRNNVQIPNTPEGTRFSMSDLQGNGPWPVARLYLTWNINSRHGLRALAAPLSVTETGTLPTQTLFAEATFDANTPTEATYKFNSWRLSYRYRLYKNPRWSWWIGFTGKIRDAKIELTQGSTSAEKTDVGFVPLLHISGWYRLSDRLRLAVDVDALAGGPGRAEDAALKLYVDLEQWSLAAGYRTVEGGADVDEVYNFAWLHYGITSVSYRF